MSSNTTKRAPWIGARAGSPNFYIYYYETETAKEPKRRSTGTQQMAEAEIALQEFLQIYNHAGHNLNIPSILEVIQCEREKDKDKDLSTIKIRQEQNGVQQHSKGGRENNDGIARERHCVNRLKMYFKDYSPNDITKQSIKEYALFPTLKGRIQAASSVEKDLSVLRKFLNAGFEQGLTPFPCPDFEIKRSATVRTIYFSKDQAQKIIGHADCYHGQIFSVLAFGSGQRMTAILQLTWDRIDFEKRMIYFQVPDTEETNKKRGQVPMNDELYAALMEAKEYTQKHFLNCQHVVHYNGQPIKDAYNAFVRARNAAGIEDGSPHCCKHSVISWLAMNGYSVDDISDFTSTSPKIVYKHYRKINPEGLRPMAESLSLASAGKTESSFTYPKDVMIIEGRKGKKIMIASTASIEIIETAISDGLLDEKDVPDTFITTENAIRKLS